MFLPTQHMHIVHTGLPIPVVAISVGISHKQYGSNNRLVLVSTVNKVWMTHAYRYDRCWISEEKGAIWAFIGPMLFIIMVRYLYNITLWKMLSNYILINGK